MSAPEEQSQDIFFTYSCVLEASCRGSLSRAGARKVIEGSHASVGDLVISQKFEISFFTEFFFFHEFLFHCKNIALLG